MNDPLNSYSNMKKIYETPLAVEIASEILQMHQEIKRLRAENEDLKEYREKYVRLLKEDISHGEIMRKHFVSALSK